MPSWRTWRRMRICRGISCEMDKTLFGELVGSLKQAQTINKGQAQPSRRFELFAPDVKAVREQTGLSQGDFAKLMRVGVNKLQNSE